MLQVQPRRIGVAEPNMFEERSGRADAEGVPELGRFLSKSSHAKVSNLHFAGVDDLEARLEHAEEEVGFFTAKKRRAWPQERIELAQAFEYLPSSGEGCCNAPIA